MRAAEILGKQVGVKAACSALCVPRSTLYRRRRPAKPTPQRPSPPLALSAEERAVVLAHLRSERFVDHAPRQVWAELLDEGTYLCSVRTMYRYLEAEGELRERRNQCRRPSYAKPELLATEPNEVWSWDITKLRGPEKWSYYYLYVILDIFSRYVTGWMLAQRECSYLAEELIRQTCEKQRIEPGRLTIHADRGSSMSSKPVAHLYGELGVCKSHSRPYTSNDNPYSEAQFKTLKYRPEFPDRFGSYEDAEAFCKAFFGWYNGEHRHSALALVTPEQVHYGTAESILDRRAEVLRTAFETNPSRFKGHAPKPGKLPAAAWINPPKSTEENAH